MIGARYVDALNQYGEPNYSLIYCTVVFDDTEIFGEHDAKMAVGVLVCELLI